MVAKEIGTSATEEAKDLGKAATQKATQKVLEMSEKRQRKRANKHNDNATEAAIKLASEQEINLDETDGSGAGGRITVRDVKQAAEQ